MQHVLLENTWRTIEQLITSLSIMNHNCDCCFAALKEFEDTRNRIILLNAIIVRFHQNKFSNVIKFISLRNEIVYCLYRLRHSYFVTRYTAVRSRIATVTEIAIVRLCERCNRSLSSLVRCLRILRASRSCGRNINSNRESVWWLVSLE